jgi:hypothetical protein
MTSRNDNRGWARRAGGLVLVAGAAMAMVSGAGCEEKKPAPKVAEAPPPPPPPPPPMSIDAIAQQLKVDPRVQLNPKLTGGEEAFARAALKLANAIAKGDSAALKPMLTRRAAEALDFLTAGEGWKQATGGIEAVRVVAIGPPPPNMKINASPAAGAAGAAANRALLDQALEGITRGMKPEDAARERELFERRIRAEAERSLARQSGGGGGGATEGGGDGGTPAADASKGGDAALEALVSGLIAAEAANQRANQVFEQGSTQAVLLAVQDEQGAYLMGWQAVRDGDGYKFDLAPSSGVVKRRAAEFDELGMKGFEIAPPSRFAGMSLPAAGDEKGADSGKGGGGGSSGTGG